MNNRQIAQYLYDEFYMGYVRSSVVKAVVSLGIVEEMKESAVSVEYLAIRLGVDTNNLQRLMDTGVQMGLFLKSKDETYTTTELSLLLSEDHPMSMLGLFQMMSEDYFTDSLSHLPDTVRTGIPSFSLLHQQDFYSYLNDTSKNEVFSRAMRSIDSIVSPLVASSYDWSDTSTVLDIGGGCGSTASSIVKENEKVHVTILDIALPSEPIQHDRISYIRGDMFDSSPLPNYDIYLVKNIFHDLADEQCLSLLRRIRCSSKTPRVIVVEKIVDKDKLDPHSAGHDIVKMSFFNSDVPPRLVKDIISMMKQVGFRHTRSIPLLGTSYFIIEGRLTQI